jgi:hypothetical protein
MATADVIAGSGIQTGGPPSRIVSTRKPSCLISNSQSALSKGDGTRLTTWSWNRRGWNTPFILRKTDFRSRLSRLLGALRFAHLFLLSGGPVNFPATFALSPLSVALRVQNVPHRFIKALVTKRLTSSCYACQLAASARKADAALCFFQAINAAHFPESSSLTFKEEARAGLHSRRTYERNIGRWIRSGRHS